MLASGEALPPATVRRFPAARPGVEPHNLYGPNEASIDVTAWRFLAGPGLASGYLRQPGLTAGRFLPDPYADQPGQRMYAAGDLARWRCDGQLEYLGRTDRQATLRGQRIEPGESERALTARPGVRQAAVILHEHARVAGPGQPVPGPGELREHVARRLPANMIPAAFAVLPELPPSANGKLGPARLADASSVAGEHVPADAS